MIWGSVSGLIAYSGLIWWLFPVHLIGAVLLVICLGMQIFLWSILFFRADLRYWIFFNAAAWVVSEWIRSFWLGGLQWTLANSQTFYPEFIQVFDILGPLGISFFIVVVNGCIYAGLKRGIKARYVLLAVGLLVIMYGYGKWKIAAFDKVTDTKKRVCLVQPNVSALDKQDPDKVGATLKKILKLSEQCFVGAVPDLVVLPETAVADDIRYRADLRREISSFLKIYPAHLLIGSALLENAQNYNSAVLFGPDDRIIGKYDKQTLVPFVEYYPFGRFARNQLYNKNYEFVSGGFDLNLSMGKSRFGTLICSEDGYSRLIRKMEEQHPEFFVVLLSDAWTRVPQALMMHLQNAIVQAVSFRVPVLRCANSGWTGSIYPSGYLSQDSRYINQEGVFIESFYRREHGRSLYSKYGDFFGVLCLFFVIIILFSTGKRSGKI
ncbi:MAG: apolipoprotein N-acyltransferase [Candidatus Omnitrophica bacterium]|nr:apolipoprotein N-acyltransferase [Candidatus Omnitrophota bacterium]